MRRLVLGHDRGRDAAALVDVEPLRLGPRPDVAGPLAVGGGGRTGSSPARRAGAAAGAGATDAATGADVGLVPSRENEMVSVPGVVSSSWTSQTRSTCTRCAIVGVPFSGW